MSKFVLTIWLCLTAHPDCSMNESAAGAVALDMGTDSASCEAVAKELPPPLQRKSSPPFLFS